MSSPVREPQDLEVKAVDKDRFRLWIFNPHAYAVGNWVGAAMPAAISAEELAEAIRSQTAEAEWKRSRGVTLWLAEKQGPRTDMTIDLDGQVRTYKAVL